ncbi:hypothetical protein NBRC116601_24350 [Cognatishimia sp. WU-CL00825]|uniref:hypothetical protein n=1 Tax=Cognatishimia sp. WU-CL00825 TaxID=3127658 RepID=UPI003108B7EC
MTPDFALSLSFEGISLLCRVPEGWHKLGEVPLQHADLDAALADLRGLGEAQANGSALCKIILPDDQIKYLSLPSAQTTTEQTVLAALEGATPYATDDLAYDFVEDDFGIQVAAVAKETLAEAENFAREHGFEPVCFVAKSASDDFNAEAFFGKTHSATELVDDPSSIRPDSAVVSIVSEGPLERPKSEETQPSAPPFATSRRLTAIAETPSEDATPLPGAHRSLEAQTDGAEPQQDTAKEQLATPSIVGTQEPRFDPATLIAGLKQRPESAKDPRARGTSRQTPPVVSKTADAPAIQKENPSIQSGTSTPPPVQVQSVGGKPRYLALVLVALLLLFLAGAAAWASLFTEGGLAGLFSRQDSVPQIALVPEDTKDVESSVLPPTSVTTVTDSAEIEAMDANEGIVLDPVLAAAGPTNLGDAFYAATGIWDRSPMQPATPRAGSAEGIYLGAFETQQQTHDAIALPTAASYTPDSTIKKQNNPVAAGVTFELDERGLVVATAEGALSPEGIMVYLGKPAVVPTAFPDRTVPEAEIETPAIDPEVLKLASLRPRLRPSDLIEQNQRATLGGSTLAELAKYRPKLRPAQLEKIVSVDPAAIDLAVTEAVSEGGTDQAVLASLRPKLRPKNLPAALAQPKNDAPAVAVPRSERAAPAIPTTASVARNATQKNVINLKKINLIGVYGATNDRRALVRLASGRYKKVKVGDRIDGGKVAAISSNELRYVKGQKSHVLKMPKG